MHICGVCRSEAAAESSASAGRAKTTMTLTGCDDGVSTCEVNRGEQPQEPSSERRKAAGGRHTHARARVW